jgi:hypothetical protein
MTDPDCEILYVSHEANPTQLWSVQKVAAAGLKRYVIDEKIRQYQASHPEWASQNICDVTDEITKEVKKECPKLVSAIVRNIVWTVLSSKQSGSCAEGSKKNEYEEKIVVALASGLGFGDRDEADNVSSEEEGCGGSWSGVVCAATQEMNHSVNANAVLLEYEDVPAKLVDRVRRRYQTLELVLVEGGAQGARRECGEQETSPEVVEAVEVEENAGGRSGEGESREAIFNPRLQIGQVNREVRAEFEDAKALMPLAKCTEQEWCALCHWCGGRQAKQDRCVFHRFARKEWFRSYQGLLLLMHREAPETFCQIQSSSSASTALKRKLNFLLQVFTSPRADIILAEVNPSYVSSRFRLMKHQTGNAMNVASIKALLTSFRIYFNVVRIDAAQKSVSISAQGAVEQFVQRNAEFEEARRLNLFEGRKRKRGSEASGDEETEGEASGHAGEGEEVGPENMSRKERFAAGLQRIFSSVGIQLGDEVVLKALSEHQGAPESAARSLERSYLKQAVFTHGSIVDARYSTGQTFYRARVVKKQSDGKFLIEWDDGDEQDCVKSSSELRLPRIDIREWRTLADGHHVGDFPCFGKVQRAASKCIVLSVAFVLM